MVGQLEWIGGVDPETSSRSLRMLAASRLMYVDYRTNSQKAVILVEGDIIQSRHVVLRCGFVSTLELCAGAQGHSIIKGDKCILTLSLRDACLGFVHS